MLSFIKVSFKYFIVGILAFIPIVIVLQVIVFLESILRGLFIYVYGYSNNIFLTIALFALSFSAISYVGYKITSAKKLWILSQVETVINQIPMIKTIYRVSQKLVNLFSNPESNLAKEIVFIEYPKEGLWVPAYITNKIGDMLVVYVPTSPNPTSGFTIVVHKSKIVKSNMDIEAVTSFVVSVGVDIQDRSELEKLATIKTSN